jgi:uncharacterized radical SAM superfamily Fe-S cluster-containing enzyme
MPDSYFEELTIEAVIELIKQARKAGEDFVTINTERVVTFNEYYIVERLLERGYKVDHKLKEIVIKDLQGDR